MDLLRALRKSGLPVTIVRVELTPEEKKREKQTERAVRKYIMKIEEAHERAASSTLRFGNKIGAPAALGAPFIYQNKNRP